jgi:hypothetical protein
VQHKRQVLYPSNYFLDILEVEYTGVGIDQLQPNLRMNNSNSRLHALYEREKALRDRIAREKLAQQKREETQRKRLATLLGGVLLTADLSPTTRVELLRIVAAASTALPDRQKKQLRDAGWL